MGSTRTVWVHLLIVAITALLFVGGGHLAAVRLIDAQQSRQLDELLQIALRRSETAVDYGVEAIERVAARGPMSCDPVSLQAIRLQVYRSSSVKDIRAVSESGTVRCSAYSETLEFDGDGRRAPKCWWRTRAHCVSSTSTSSSARRSAS